MRILVIGSGGREHALVWKLRQSPTVTEVLVAPGNGGTAAEGVRNIDIAVDDLAGLVRLAVEEKVDMAIPGPELPLTLGIVDAMEAAGIPCFGPSKYCAQLEGSKAFAKEVMRKGNVPTAASAAFTDYDEARAYIEKMGAPLVVKADGLAAGKGVVVASTETQALEALDAIMRDKVHGDAGTTVVIEDFLEGEEVSFLCFCDGEHIAPMPSAQDHKAAFDGDVGPNTGGMGAYSPAPIMPDADAAAMAELVIRPIMRVLAEAGHPFKGVLYAGLMMTEDGPKVLEYNTRFGDPECQPLLMRLESPLDEIMMSCIKGTLDTIELRYTPRTALGIVLTAQGYPEKYPKGMEISNIADADAQTDVKVFHSGTIMDQGRVLANGGRILCITALGNDIEEAQRKAYAALSRIRMEKGYFRTDIGLKGIRRLRKK